MDIEQENVKFFDELADRYDVEDWVKKISQQVTAAIHAHLIWIGVDWVPSGDSQRVVRLLDYASGTGTVSRALESYVTVIKGIDIAPNMVKIYNQAAEEAGLSRSKMSAVEGNLFARKPSKGLEGAEYFDFDIVSVGLGYHHFADVKLATARLVERLKPGGVLFIIDLIEHQAHSEQRANASDGAIHKHGFGEGEIEEIFAAAGLVENRVSVCEENLVMRRNGSIQEKTMFLARGTKPKK